MTLDAEVQCISIHAPPRGATYALVHGVCWGYWISIHAPRGGATTECHTMAQAEFISIHAPPRGATATSWLMVSIVADFNSRPSARGDTAELIDEVLEKFQFTPLREGRLDCL